MKMTANISESNLFPSKKVEGINDIVECIVSTKWKLQSITETGIVSDEAAFKDVEIVFSQYHIYALYGNRVDKFKYKFLSKKTFSVKIENEDIKCRIKELNEHNLIFHADFRNSHFILELETE